MLLKCAPQLEQMRNDMLGIHRAYPRTYSRVPAENPPPYVGGYISRTRKSLTLLLFVSLCPLHLCAGVIVGWGDKTDQQLAFTGIDAVTIAAGGFQSLLAQADGSILVSQAPSKSVIVADTTGDPVVALAAGYAHGLAIRRDGTSFTFGNNDHGQTVIPASGANLLGIAAGAYHCLGLRPDGRVTSWGDNYQNQRIPPAGLNSVMAVAAGYY